ncbi:NAD dependent epimerase/dehydratase [Aspergillus steynii IBT 23096]|uniref:NAD dependent epimerase/dehydratase n=1 Tax=Aspergillus steynii IBT 23096 TaxID=1392250 RepID=A0A2I2G5H5_9EURO|nr:NAD dependent epimerase/dehydratase [Aspergillus steynii IBT 23096]PLB48132.1 NAD dependent epimerase/dehydratase [Aspergillus steynii IBT 23096]
MDPASFALPLGSRILVTGANGYIASHVIDKLLELGYVVRGTVRAEKPWLNEYFRQKYGGDSFETVQISSFVDVDAIQRALGDVDGVIHLASDLSFSSDPNAIIPWVVQATLNILEIAARKQRVRRVVLASSSSASYMILPDPNGRQVYADSWDDVAVAAAWDDKTPADIKGVAVYAASKTEGERQSWKWIERHDPQYTFNAVLPSFNVGRILHPEIPGSTMGSVRQLLRGDATTFAKFPEQWYVDVEDVARLCVIGLLDPKVQSERIFAFAEQKHWTDTVAVLRDLRPKNRSIPDAPTDIPRDNTTIHPRGRAESLLREFYGQDGFTPIRESISRGIEGWE